MAPLAAAETHFNVPAMSGKDHPPYQSWGRYPPVFHRAVYRAASADQVSSVLHQSEASSLLPYGLGRSYGDSCLNDGRDLLDCAGLNRILEADFETGTLRCEAGTSLAKILEIVVPRGWFLPVVPGTKFVTVGGAIANDIHGKNHHRSGTFGCHVHRFGLHRSHTGELVCSRAQNSELFRATIGGLGLTGVILWAEIQLKRIPGAAISAERIPFRSLNEFLALTAESDQSHEHTVAWLDCFSKHDARGIFFRGNHAATVADGAVTSQSRLRIPFTFPEWLLNSLSMRAFNCMYELVQRSNPRRSIGAYDPFFFPLDSIRDWNLLYGKHGFLQYQCVMPEDGNCLRKLLDLIGRSGMGSFLAVLKKFGNIASPGLLSFPRPGLTLALDFPMRGQRTLALLNALDEVVLSHGGALYPAKDARMSPGVFQASFPNWRESVAYMDPKLSSSFWRRVTRSPGPTPV